MTRTPPIVKVADPVDLIALLPTLAGMPLANSLVLAPFVGSRTRAAMRVDLPADRSPTALTALASAMIGHLARVPQCDGAAIAIFTDEPYASARGVWDALERSLSERLHAAGMRILARLLIAGDGWESFDAPIGAGQSLALIEAGAALLPVAAPTAWTLPDVDAALCVRVQSAVSDLLAFGLRRGALGVYRHAELPEPVGFLETLLTVDPTDLGSDTIAQLSVLIQSGADVDRTVLQIAFGVPRRPRSPRRAVALLCGQGAETPSPARMQRGTALLARVAVHAPRTAQPPLLCAVAWLLWAQGRQSHAADVLDRSRRTAPDHALTHAFAAAFATLPLARWIFDRHDHPDSADHS